MLTDVEDGSERVRLSVTREDYFEAAMRLLATEGHSALKMSALCKSLQISSGSFYNYFGSWDGFIPQLLTYWEKEQTVRIRELSSRPSDPLARIATMRRLATDLPHDSEFAIRAWSNADEVVAEFQRRVDQDRVANLRDVIATLVPDSASADTLATLGISILVGLQSIRSPLDRDELHRLLDEFETIVRLHADIPVSSHR